MPSFDYIGRDSHGKEVRGILNASSKDGVAEQLMKDNIIPIKVELAKNTKMSILQKDIFGGKIKLEEMMAFCRQMYTMIKVGIPVIDALNHVAETTKCQVFQTIIPQMAEAISSGTTFAEAIRQHPKHFPKVFSNIVSAGETSGQLEKAFLQLSEHMEKENETRKKIKAAVRYPVIVLVVTVIAIGIVNFMVIPSFVTLFQKFDAELPASTKFLMATSSFMLDHWLALLITFIAIVIGIKFSLRLPTVRYHWHHMILHLPIIGRILNNAMLSRFARMFAMILETGIPLMQGIEIVANTIGNEYVTKNILNMRESIERGEMLSLAARESNLFSPLVLQMLAIGEETGSIDTLLTEVANFYDSEVDYDLNRIGDLIEPILMVIMGGMVLLLAVGIFFPMWNMVNLIK